VNSTYILHELGSHLSSENECARALQRLADTGFWAEFVIAELIDLYASPGTLFYAGDERVKVISHTYQILDSKRSFLGFMYPIEDEMIRRHFGTIEASLQCLIEPWRELGYRGYGNIDWMVTKDGDVFLAERNARQTAVVAPLTIANRFSGLKATEAPIVAPTLSIFTRDVVDFERPVTFEEVHAGLRKKNLLLQQGGRPDGVIITMPPSMRAGLNSVGIMAVGENVSSAFETYSRTMRALGVKEVELLFGPGA
jgi:hypothetical protein